MRIIHILLFLLSKSSSELKNIWRSEITSHGKLTPFRLYIANRCRTRHFLMWWRLASQMQLKGSKRQRRVAKKISWSLQRQYASEIGLCACLGANVNFPHLTGIVISDAVTIGKNAIIYQNVTIGVKSSDDYRVAAIGDNVIIGAGACILGGVTIGNNVKIGAMSLVISDVPDNSTYVCTNVGRIISHD